MRLPSIRIASPLVSSSWNSLGILTIFNIVLWKLQGPIYASASSIPQTTKMPITMLNPIARHESPHPALPGRFAILEPTTMTTKQAERTEVENNEKDEVTINRLPYVYGLRRLIGDLETCTEDLFPLGGEKNTDDEVLISGSRVRSCREAIFSFLRWARAGRDQLWNPQHPDPPDAMRGGGTSQEIWGWEREMSSVGIQQEYQPDWETMAHCEAENGYCKRSEKHSDGEEVLADELSERNAGLESKAAITHPGKPLTCKESVCKTEDLHALCSKKGGRLEASNSKTCKMCYPKRNEKLIRKHCAKRDQREKQVFYVLCAMLITAVAAAGVLVLLHNIRRRHLESGPETGSEKGFSGVARARLVKAPTLGKMTLSTQKESWMSKTVSRFRRPKNITKDVEEHPTTGNNGLCSGTNVVSRIPTSFVGSLNHPDSPSPRIDSTKNTNGMKLRRSRDSSLGSVEMVPVMPRARSSSVQMPSPTSIPTEPESLFNIRDDGTRQRHCATIHGTNPIRRGQLPRKLLDP